MKFEQGKNMPLPAVEAHSDEIRGLLTNLVASIAPSQVIAAIAMAWVVLITIFHLFGTAMIILKYSIKKSSRIRRAFFKDSGPEAKLSDGDLTCLPSVTILRPLKGVDFNLYSNLESSFEQDYPKSKVQILFTVADSDDPAIPVVQQLLQKYKVSGQDARLIIMKQDARELCKNPKVNNMIQGYNQATGQVIWVCDSNVKSSRNTLCDAARHLSSVEYKSNKRVGLVHHLPVGVQHNSFGGLLELVNLSTFHAKSYLAINVSNFVTCVNGKSTLFHKADLESIGGMLAYANSISEDNQIGRDIRYKANRSIVLSDNLANQSLGGIKVTDYIARQKRWIVIRKYIEPATIILEPLQGIVVVGLLFSASTCVLSGITSIATAAALFAGYICFMLLVDSQAANALLSRENRGCSWALFALAWLVREFIALPLFLTAVWGTSVRWRNKDYRLVAPGIVESAAEGAEARQPVKKIDVPSEKHIGGQGTTGFRVLMSGKVSSPRKNHVE